MVEKKLRRLNNLLSKVEERKMEKLMDTANEVADFTVYDSREAKKFQKQAEDLSRDITRIEDDLNELLDEYPEANVAEIRDKIQRSKSVLEPYKVKYEAMLTAKDSAKAMEKAKKEEEEREQQEEREREREEKERKKVEREERQREEREERQRAEKEQKAEIQREETAAKQRLETEQRDRARTEKEQEERTKKLRKEVEKDFFMFDQFAMSDVRNIKSVSGSVDDYRRKIEDAIEKLEKAEKSLAEFISKHPDVNISELQQKIQDGRADIEEHFRQSELELADEAYYNDMGGSFASLAAYFGEWGNRSITSFNVDEKYAYSDTERMLTLTEKFTPLKVVDKNNYDISIQRLNDDKFIDEYYEYLDQQIRREKDEGKAAHEHYDLLYKIQNCMFPDNENLKGILHYLNKLKGKLDNERQQAASDVIISDFHASHLNQVFFTDNETKPAAELTENDMKTIFQPGETIRCIAFLDNTFCNIYGKYSKAHFHLENGSYCDTEEFTKDDLDKGYIDFKIVTDAKNYTLPETASYSSVEITMQMLLDLPPRMKSIEVTVKSDGGGTGTVPASNLVAKFKIDGTDDEGLKLLRKNLKIVKAASLANERVPEPSMQDAALEQEILTFFEGLKWEESFKKTIITSSGYYAIKNSEEISVARGLEVTMLSETDTGCFKQDFTIAQDQIGEDWTGFRLQSRGSKSEISCQKIS